jgi:hypothetical protein
MTENEKYKVGVATSAMKFILDFMTLHQLVQQYFKGTGHTEIKIKCLSL